MKIKLIDDSGKEIEFKKTNIKRSDETLTVVQIVNPLISEPLSITMRDKIAKDMENMQEIFAYYGINTLILFVPDKNHFARFDTLKKNKME